MPEDGLSKGRTCSTHVQTPNWIQINLCCVKLIKCGLFSNKPNEMASIKTAFYDSITIIIIIIIIISFMQGIYTCIPETNYIPREYSVAAVLLLLYMVLISLVPVSNLLYFYISTFLSRCAVPNMADFCSSLTSCFPGMLLTCFLNDFAIVPVAPIITGITFVFTFHMRCISIVRSLNFRIFSATF